MELAGKARWMDAQARLLRIADVMGRRLRPGVPVAEHLATGLRGEREALFHLRAQGYTVVARRWRNAKLRGDVDLIGWDKDWLCFVEVKTRTGRDEMSPAQSAVDADKQDMLRRMARVYLRSFPEELRRRVLVRFDILSVYIEQAGVEFDLYKGAFGWESHMRRELR